jgi:hypothetical protein
MDLYGFAGGRDTAPATHAFPVSVRRRTAFTSASSGVLGAGPINDETLVDPARSRCEPGQPQVPFDGHPPVPELEQVYVVPELDLSIWYQLPPLEVVDRTL